MRTRINVTYTAGTRSIDTGITDLTIEDIRLIVNETQKRVLCSSMQKDLITSVTNGVVTYVSTSPVLAQGDKITFEIDKGDDYPSAIGVLSEIASGKQAIASAINAKGGSASATESFSELAEKIEEINWQSTADVKFFDDYTPKNSHDVVSHYNEITEMWKMPEVPNETCPNVVKLEIIRNQNFNFTFFGTYPNLKYLYLPDTNMSLAFPYDGRTSTPTDVEIVAPNVTTLNFGTDMPRGLYILKKLTVGTLTSVVVTYNRYGYQYRLRDVTIGFPTNVSMNLGAWDARDVIAEGQSGIDELNNNIQNHFIANLADNTGLTAKTVIFGQNLRNVLTAETEQMFADKNWNIAPAKTV